MPEELGFLTPRDKTILQKMKSELQQLLSNNNYRMEQDKQKPDPSPDVYVARLTECTKVDKMVDNVPGKAKAKIYKLVRDNGTDPDSTAVIQPVMLPGPGRVQKTVTVFNIYEFDFEAGENDGSSELPSGADVNWYFQTHRSKFGFWLVERPDEASVCPSSSESTGVASTGVSVSESTGASTVEATSTGASTVEATSTGTSVSASTGVSVSGSTGVSVSGSTGVSVSESTGAASTPSSTSLIGTSSSSAVSTSFICIHGVAGYDTDSIPWLQGDLQSLLGFDVNGCLVRVPISECN